MKKSLIVLSLLLLVCSILIIGCGSKPEEETKETQPVVTTPSPPVTTTPPPAVTPPPVSIDVKNGFTESQRKSMFWDLIVAQDAGTPGDPQSDATAYAVVAAKYNTDVWVVRDIGMEGISKNWPMPPSP
jgi:hypothetical protein